MQARILLTIRLIRNIQFVPQTYLKYLEGPDFLYEIRVSLVEMFLEYFTFLTRDTWYLF